uniref:SCP domain-containing protein n=2 Tax=Strongyloides stercoralis TaxID=6248 RepID=A0AAF5I3V3_STRER
MNLLIIISLLISFVVQTYEYNYVSVPVSSVYSTDGKFIYSYKGENYDSKKKLVYGIKMSFREVPIKYLLIHIISLRYGNRLNISATNSNFIRVDSDKSFHQITLPNTHYLIKVTSFNGKMMFKCNGGLYDNYAVANHCMDDIKKYNKIKSQYQLVGKDESGNKIWRNIWSDCYYKCFSKRNFQILTENLAKKIASKEKGIAHFYATIAAKIIVSTISLPFANVQVNKCMSLFSIVSLLILFVLQTFEYNYLAVPVTSIFYQGGSESFAYQGMYFNSRKDLIENIKRTFRYVPCKYLLIHLTAIRFRNVVNVSSNYKNFIKTDSKPPFTLINIPPSLDLIRIVTIENKQHFECNSNFFTSYYSANKCMDDTRKYDKLKSQYKLIGKDWHSRIIWRFTWKNCYYKCFSSSNFEILREKLLDELNGYRESLRLNKVTVNYALYLSAEKLAKKIAEKGNKINYYSHKFPIETVVGNISLPFANTQMNKWYTTFLSMKKNNHDYILEKKNIIYLFTLYTTQVGFGIFKANKYLIIVCMYR